MIGLPTSVSSKSAFLRRLVSSINFLYLSSTILASNNVPIFDDLISMSSTDKFFGKSFISDILYFEHLIDHGYFLL